jgi:hypothetical protein
MGYMAKSPKNIGYGYSMLECGRVELYHNIHTLSNILHVRQ